MTTRAHSFLQTFSRVEDAPIEEIVQDKTQKVDNVNIGKDKKAQQKEEVDFNIKKEDIRSEQVRIEDTDPINEKKEVKQSLGQSQIRPKTYKNLIENIKNKTNQKQNIELIELKIEPLTIQNIKETHQFVLAERPSSRLMRLFWAILILFFSVIALVLCIKGSIQWSSRSKNELNKIKDAYLRQVSEGINTKYTYFRE
jgi:hypothetical protein